MSLPYEGCHRGPGYWPISCGPVLPFVISFRRASDRAVEPAEQVHDGINYYRCGIDLEVRGARPPRFVATELVLFRRGQVAVVSIGQLDGEGRFERALALYFEANFRKHLAGNR